jgi:hypothetical protein
LSFQYPLREPFGLFVRQGAFGSTGLLRHSFHGHDLVNDLLETRSLRWPIFSHVVIDLLSVSILVFLNRAVLGSDSERSVAFPTTTPTLLSQCPRHRPPIARGLEFYYRTRRTMVYNGAHSGRPKWKPGLKNIWRKRNEKIGPVRVDGFDHCSQRRLVLRRPRMSRARIRRT